MGGGGGAWGGSGREGPAASRWGGVAPGLLLGPSWVASSVALLVIAWMLPTGGKPNALRRRPLRRRPRGTALPGATQTTAIRGLSPTHAPTRRPMGNTDGSFSRQSPLVARPNKPSAEPVASLAAVGKLSVEPVYGLSPFRRFRR